MTGAPEREGDTVPALALVPSEADPAIVRKLEALLEGARRGDVRFLAFAVLASDADECDYGTIGSVSAYRAIGILETLKHWLIAQLVKHQVG